MVVGMQPMGDYVEGNVLQVDRAATGASGGNPVVDDIVMKENNKSAALLSVPSTVELSVEIWRSDWCDDQGSALVAVVLA